MLDQALENRPTAPSATTLDGAPAAPPQGSADTLRTGAPTRERALSSVERASTYRRALAGADMVAALATLGLTAYVIAGTALTPAVALVPIAIVVMVKALGLYDRDEYLLSQSTIDELPRLFALATTATVAVWLAGGAFVVDGLERGAGLFLLVALTGSMVTLRSGTRHLARRSTSADQILFVGDVDSAETLSETLRNTPRVRADLVGWVDPNGSNALADDSDFAAHRELVERILAAVDRVGADRVVLGPGPGRTAWLLDAIRQMKLQGLAVSVMPEAARVIDTSVLVDRLSGISLLSVQRFEITKSSRIIKRTVDVAASTLALVAVLPLLAVVMLLIKIDSRGPVLFRQRRAGRDGQAFSMVKLRTMVDGADRMKADLMDRNEADGVFKIADDPRITRLGGILRQLHVDELPQLWNVLVGDMSLVGPRPLPLDEDERIEGWHRRRLDIRPGITGPWQVLGSSRVPVAEMVKLDYQYVANWSLWNDIRLLLLTVGHIVRRGGL